FCDHSSVEIPKGCNAMLSIKNNCGFGTAGKFDRHRSRFIQREHFLRFNLGIHSKNNRVWKEGPRLFDVLRNLHRSLLIEKPLIWFLALFAQNLGSLCTKRTAL